MTGLNALTLIWWGCFRGYRKYEVRKLLHTLVCTSESSRICISFSIFERRFGDNVSVELRLRAITNSEQDEPLYSFSRDDYIQLQISRYF